MHQKSKRILITTLKFAISAGILAFLFASAWQGDQFERLIHSQVNWMWIGIGWLGCLTAHVLGFIRWRLMVRALGLPFSIRDAIRIGFIGLFFNLFAFGVLGGDTLRAFYVTRQIPSRAPEAIASVVADRMIGLLTMLLVASIAFLNFDTTQIAIHTSQMNAIRYTGNVILGLTAVGFSGLVALFCTPQLASLRWYKNLTNVPKIGAIAKRLTAVILMYRRRPGTVIASFLISVGVNVGFAVTIYGLAAGLTPVYPSFANHFIIEPISMVSNALPLPGGLGGMEFALSFLYEAFGSDSGVVIAFAFRFALLSVSAIGAVFWLMNRSKIANAIEAEAKKAGSESPTDKTA